MIHVYLLKKGIQIYFVINRLQVMTTFLNENMCEDMRYSQDKVRIPKQKFFSSILTVCDGKRKSKNKTKQTIVNSL